MKNITVSVPDEVYRRARVQAARQGTSVSRLVRDFLEGVDDRDTEFQRLADLQRRVAGEIGTFRAADRVPRDEVHERAIR